MGWCMGIFGQRYWTPPPCRCKLIYSKQILHVWIVCSSMQSCIIVWPTFFTNVSYPRKYFKSTNWLKWMEKWKEFHLRRLTVCFYRPLLPHLGRRERQVAKMCRQSTLQNWNTFDTCLSSTIETSHILPSTHNFNYFPACPPPSSTFFKWESPKAFFWFLLSAIPFSNPLPGRGGGETGNVFRATSQSNLKFLATPTTIFQFLSMIDWLFYASIRLHISHFGDLPPPLGRYAFIRNT